MISPASEVIYAYILRSVHLVFFHFLFVFFIFYYFFFLFVVIFIMQ